MVDSTGRFDELDAIFADLGMDELEEGESLPKRQLAAAWKSIFLQVSMTMMTNAEAKKAILAVIRDAGKP
ncbi:hypothetical protein D3C72_2538760 [compost metagenome]